MIQPNELRIGNFVDFNSEVAKVRQILEMEVIFKCGDSELFANIKPIQLTGETLPKCGFEEVGMYSNVYHKDNIRIHTDKTGKTDTVLFVMFNDDDSIFSKEISSVHQLQNLYFALLEKELPMKF